MSVTPRSSAAQRVWIERSSSVPPHIQPPIAQVPSPMREGERLVPGIVTYSMTRLPLEPRHLGVVGVADRSSKAAVELLALEDDLLRVHRLHGIERDPELARILDVHDEPVL